MICREEIWQAFPAGSYAIAGLMRILEIRESRDVPTAAISGGDTAVILLNPDYVARHAPTPERQAALILHELMHYFLGHIQKASTPLENFVFDAIINATICHLTRDQAYWSLFTSYYSSERFPECLLRPPAGFRPNSPDSFRTPRILAGERMKKGREALRALYENEGATYSDILQLFDLKASSTFRPKGGRRLWYAGVQQGEAESGNPQAGHEIPRAAPEKGEPDQRQAQMPGGEVPLEKVRLLGSHPPRASLDDLKRSGFQEACLGVFQDIQRKLPGRHGDLFVINEKVKIPPSIEDRNTAVLAQLVRKVATAGHAALPIPDFEAVRTLTAVPALDRRSNVLRLLGVPTLLHNWEVQIQQPLCVDPVQVYVDVSGSVFDFIGSLSRVVLQCRSFVAQEVCLFSERVVRRRIHELASGKIETTYGTDINCVLRHMERNGIRRALILTDGNVGRPLERYHEHLRRCNLAVALTPGGSLSNLSPWVRHHGHLLMS